MVLLVQRLIGVTQAGLLYNLQPSPKVPQCLSWDVTRRCSQENNLITCCNNSYFKKKMEWVIYFCLLVSKSPVTSLTKIAAKAWGASVASGKARGCSSPWPRLALSHQYWLQVKNAGFFPCGRVFPAWKGPRQAMGLLCPSPGSVSHAANPPISPRKDS